MLGLSSDRERRERLERIFRENGLDEFAWIDPAKIVGGPVGQDEMHLRLSGPTAAAAAARPTLRQWMSGARRFFSEYVLAAVFHHPAACPDPKERKAWTAGIGRTMVELERQVFLAGHEKAFVMSQGCSVCQECETDRTKCREPKLARPSPEAMAMDVYTTVRSIGLPIQVKTDPSQRMDRYSFLMVD